ncbi:MAG TPA: AAA family ATPase, partial [Lysobacter sp.]|nr:AAA family ATPase [Lysobacter sp.]
ETICEELRLEPGDRRGSRKSLVDLLNAYLLQAYADGLRVVLIIDEAQNLSADALEQVRLLTNLETPTQKLLQIILIGQPELRTMLARNDLRQLAQRITARYHLTPLDVAETAQYLRHRWRVAGGAHFPFTAEATQRLHRHAGGVPRLINVIAERTLLAGYAHDASSLHARWVDRAASEALAPKRGRWPRRGIALAVAATAAAVLAAVLWLWPSPVAVPEASAAASASAGADAVAQSPADLATAPADAPAAVTVDAGGLAQRIVASDGGRSAWQALLAMWQVPADGPSTDPAAGCAAAPQVPHLHCVRGIATLDKLATLGRPALLRVRDGDTESWALLLGLDALDVRLQMHGEVLDVDRVALDHAWTGDYVALWPAPAALELAPGALPVNAFGTGASGPVIDWVAAQLQPRYLAATSAPARVDATMREAVRSYQRARGLASDGVIGPETLMAMSSRHDGARLLLALE